jgi:FkbM family methyltransferase
LSYDQIGGITISTLTTRVRKLAGILRVPAWQRALWRFHVAAGVEHANVLRNLGVVSTVVDIGANRGQFALVARNTLPNAKIISFEPLPEPAKIFRRVFAKDNLVFLHEAAIGPVKENCSMHLSARDDSSSLLPISELQWGIFPGTDEVGTVNVHVAPLSDLISENEIEGRAVLKLDVQGYEMEALQGCESLLSRFDLIYCECSFVELYSGQKLAAEVIDWLTHKGFRIKGIYNPSYDNDCQAIQADFLFCRNL